MITCTRCGKKVNGDGVHTCTPKSIYKKALEIQGCAEIINPESLILDDNNNEKGIKYDQEKPDFTLLPWNALEEVVKVLQLGANKYSRDNWKYVEPKERYDQANLRHRIAYQKGEIDDPESGFHHLAHAICCSLFKLERDLTGE